MPHPSDGPRVPTRPLRRAAARFAPALTFIRTETGSAVLLLGATVVALALANLPTADAVEQVWTSDLRLGLGDAALTLDLRHWVNDGLMAVFFLVVGLEVKRELVVGELRDPRAAALPITAALGGLAVPALLYLALTLGTDAAGGWAIGVATDIAFAVGALAILGRGLPTSAKVLLLTLAIVDDIGAILIIAVAYTETIAAGWLAVAVGTVAVISVMRRWFASPIAYVLPAVVLWVALHEAGVHATLAGVVLGLATPTGVVGGRRVLEDLEHRLHPLSAFLILPVFALANAGVSVGGGAVADAVRDPAAQGIVLALVVGKSIGISGAAWIAVRIGFATLPRDLGLRTVVAIAPLGGIGFTVALFIAGLSFDPGPRLDAAKLAILVASALAAAIAAVTLRRGAARSEGEG